MFSRLFIVFVHPTVARPRAVIVAVVMLYFVVQIVTINRHAKLDNNMFIWSAGVFPVYLFSPKPGVKDPLSQACVLRWPGRNHEHSKSTANHDQKFVTRKSFVLHSSKTRNKIGSNISNCLLPCSFKTKTAES